MHSAKVYIVILNYGRWQDTRACLESVLRSSYKNFSVLVIDNNSQNDSLEHLIEWLEKMKTIAISSNAPFYQAPEILTKEMLNKTFDLPGLQQLNFIQNDTNPGFAAGNNIVLRLLAHEDAYIWLLNPDMIIKEDSLAQLVNFAEQQIPECVIGAEVRYFPGNQGLLFYGGGKVNFLSGTIRLINNREDFGKLDYISGGCLFTHASNFERLGLLPENYFLYWEETDWCFSAKRKGVELLVCPSAVCYDKISTVIGKGYLADYYYTRNGLLFISKFRKKNIPIALFAMTIRWFIRIITGRWGRARGVFRGTTDFLKRKFNEA